MNARALVTLALGTVLTAAGCQREEVGERWQHIQREREAGEQAASVQQAEEPIFAEASLLLGNMERQIERTASLEDVHATLRSVDVELVDIDEPADALAAIDSHRLDIHNELERAAFVTDDNWPAFVARLKSMTQALQVDLRAVARRGEAVGTS